MIQCKSEVVSQRENLPALLASNSLIQRPDTAERPYTRTWRTVRASSASRSRVLLDRKVQQVLKRKMVVPRWRNLLAPWAGRSMRSARRSKSTKCLPKVTSSIEEHHPKNDFLFWSDSASAHYVPQLRRTENFLGGGSIRIIS